MKNKLQIHYASTFIVLILFVVLIMASLLTWQFISASNKMNAVSSKTMSNALMSQLFQRGNSTAYYVSETLSNALYSYDMETINNILIAINNQDTVLKSYVFDNNQKILHDGTESIESFGDAIPNKIIETLEKSPLEIGTMKENGKLTFSQNIFIGDDMIGGLVIVFSLHSIKSDIEIMNNNLSNIFFDRLKTTIFFIAIATILLVMLSISLAWIITRKLVQPIKLLADYALAIGQGNYEVKVLIDRDDEIGELANIFSDMGENLKNSTQQISHLAYHDTLTDLPNRRLFKHRLDLKIASSHRHNDKFSLLFIDIDNFKHINDSLGHDIGDELLKEVALRLKKSVRLEDDIALFGTESENSSTLARLGGDEFTILLTDMSEPPAISRVTKRIIENISKPYILDKKTANVGASIGITIFPDDGTTSTTMMKNADLAMYHAKSSGKNQFQFFSANMNTLAMAELSLERDLRYAIDHLELKMYYQPKIDLITKKIVSVEALIRWFHPEKGFISPAEFIPIAEDTGLIIPIGEWIIDSCCQQLKHWQNTPAHNIPIAINISGIQFRQKELDTFILSTLKIYHLPTHLLEIEVTETAIVHSENNANKILDSLKNAGLKIWMDDFGTGYSSLSYLRKFPVYGVKIDCSFIKHIASSESDYSLCSAIISLAESLHLQVIAEGIETEDQEVLLKQKNCRYGQGFLYYKAVTPEEILRALQQQE